MRFLLSCGLFLCVTASNLLAQEPSKEELAAAKKAFKDIGCEFNNVMSFGPDRKLLYLFDMPNSTTG